MRKHRTAIGALIVYNLVFFFPVIFMGRVLSPNDLFYNFSPWAAVRPADAAPTQNSLLNDVPTGYYTMMSLAKSARDTFHWDPYIGSGIPGFGSAAASCLSPFALIPLASLPLEWVYTAMVFLKLNAAFVFAYLWLREERLGKNGAAIGALVVAGAGAYTMRWLWQITNATALYPALLWILRRAYNGRPVPVSVTAIIAFAYAVSGFPAAMAYGAWVVVAWAVALLAGMFRSEQQRRRLGAVLRHSLRPVAGVIIGILIAVPALVPFVQFVRRTGYLEARKGTSIAAVLPTAHWKSFVKPDRLGNPAYHNWTGDPKMGVLDNYVETTVYAGLLTLPLALLGVFNRRVRGRWFWLGVALLCLAGMFGAPVVAEALARLPGIKYSALARLTLVLPLALGYLAAAARLRRRLVFQAAAILVAFDLSLFAGRFHPYLEIDDARVPSTPMTRFLQAEPRPFRIAPFFDYLWPNTSELVRVEDTRSHFGSEAVYRRLLQRIDPSAWSGLSTVISFNSLHYNFSDPLNALLGVRWFIEHREIDIIKWTIFGATVPGVQEQTGALPIRPGTFFQRSIVIDEEPFWSIELPVEIEPPVNGRGHLDVSLSRGGAPVWSRRFSAADCRAIGKIYVPLRPYARKGESVVLRMASTGLSGYALRGANATPGETPLFYGRVTTPILFERELPDGRLFRNVAELPRFRAVSRLRKLNDDEFLAARDVDFETEAVITDDPVMPPPLGPSDAKVTLATYAAGEQRVLTSASSPFFLASSEKLTPELAVTLDGREIQPIEVDMLFAGIPVPAGKHEVVFTRRIARGWWWVGGVGLLLLVVAGAVDVVGRRRRVA